MQLLHTTQPHGITHHHTLIQLTTEYSDLNEQQSQDDACLQRDF